MRSMSREIPSPPDSGEPRESKAAAPRAQVMPCGRPRYARRSMEPSVEAYWILADDGLHAFGGCASFGVQRPPARGIAVAATPSGRGVWILGADGGIFTLGDAPFHGSASGHEVRDLDASPSGDGYRVLLSDGTVMAFGDATPVEGRAQGDVRRVITDARSGGCWVLDRRGGVHAFGGAPFLGSLHDRGITAAAVDLLPDGDGYLIATADGHLARFGRRPDVIATAIVGCGHEVVAATAPRPGAQVLLTSEGVVVPNGVAGFQGSLAGAGGTALDIAAPRTHD
jgi:hypothetical protein